jgi:UDP-N-acetylmuramate dehydrogenase
MGDLRSNVELSQYTTFRVGGRANTFTTITQEEEILPALLFSCDRQLPVVVLGGGSNVLIADTDIHALVLHMQMKGISVEQKGGKVYVTAKAGENWDQFVAYTVEHGYWGLENLSAIPGTVGGAAIQNIGAYGTEVKNTIVSVRSMNTQTKEIEVLDQRSCAYEYRDSVFKKRKEFIVLSVTFCLSLDPKQNLSYQDLRLWFCEKNNMMPSQKEIRDAVIAIREKKFPDLSRTGTAGSFFKNPIVSRDVCAALLKKYPNMPHWNVGENREKLAAAWLIEHIAKLRGVQEGNVGSWKQQALVIVNYGEATASEISMFAEMIIKKIKLLTNISLEPEVVMIK